MDINGFDLNFFNSLKHSISPTQLYKSSVNFSVASDIKIKHAHLNVNQPTPPKHIYYAKPGNKEHQKHYTSYDSFQRIINMDFDEEVCRINKIPYGQVVPTHKNPKVPGNSMPKSTENKKIPGPEGEMRRNKVSSSSRNKIPVLITSKPPLIKNVAVSSSSALKTAVKSTPPPASEPKKEILSLKRKMDINQTVVVLFVRI